MSDIARLQQRPHSPSFEFKTSPLLILNNFNGEQRELKLMTIAFQNLFPTINVQKVQIDECKRAVMLNYDKDTGRIDLRHYLVKVVPAGVNKSVKKVAQKRLESMDNFADISEYVLRGAGAADSDAEDMAADSQLELPQKTKRGEIHQQQTAVRLQEMGPRMDLQLVKVEEGVCDGTVLYHAYGSLPHSLVSPSFAKLIGF
jgi:ribosome biogenesis protein SSF1/2